MDIINNQKIIRIIFFMIILVVMMVLEWKYPRRKRNFTRLNRWPSNLLLVFANSFLLSLLFPILAIGVAEYAKLKHIGIMNLINIAYPLKVILTIIVLDFVIYWQHVIFHRYHLFWLFHRMHHTDLDLDTTSGLRFHPVEIILSMIIKMIVVLILGAPIFGVLIFEILLNATSMFNHANVYLPLKIDRFLRLILVTPDMHRVHHSIIPEETNSNYGFNLPWWDRLFKTYRPQPKKGHNEMVIGLSIFRQAKYLNIGWLILIPFVNGNPL